MFRPGIVALGPLDLGAILSGAWAAIRWNPKVMLGVTAVVLVVAELVLLPTTIAGLRENRGAGLDPDAPLFSAWSLVGTGVGVVLTALVSAVLGGVLAVTVADAVLGVRRPLSRVWAAVRPRLGALALLVLLQLGILLAVVGIIAVVVVPLVLFASTVVGTLVVAISVAFGLLITVGLTPILSLAAPALILDGLGPVSALRRAARLVSGAYWRVLGIVIVVGLLVGLVGGAVALPFGLVSGLTSLFGGGPVGLAVAVLATSLGSVVSQLVTVPFAVASDVLLYLDLRMRHEGLDRVLIDATVAAGPAGVPDPVHLLLVSSRY